MVTPQNVMSYLDKFCDSFQSLTYSDFDTAIQPLKDAMAAGEVPPFETAFGCTKGVLIFKGCDFVVKIPFVGVASSYSRYCKYTGSNSTNGWDYCQREVEIYEAAKEVGVASFLAETKLVGYVKGHPIYTQSLVANIGKAGCYTRGTTPKVERQARRLQRARTTGQAHMWENLLTAMIDTCGFRLTQRFMNFCIAQKTGSDWHDGNFGLIPHTTAIVFCDYTGYRR